MTIADRQWMKREPLPRRSGAVGEAKQQQSGEDEPRSRT